MFRFIADAHLGKLARYLRLLGFDAVYEKDIDDKDIIERSLAEDRIILSRDKILLRDKKIKKSYRITSDDPREQIREVVMKFELGDHIEAFARCLECNTILIPVEKEKILDRLQRNTREYFTQFRICPNCERIFWEGSHFERMKAFADSFRIHRQ